LAAYAREDWAGAEKAAREQLKKNRDDSQARLLLARSLYRQTRDDPASAIFDNLSMQALTTEDFFLRGMAFLRSGQAEYAILTWRKGLGTNPNHAETLVALEGIFSRKDLLTEAARAATSLSTQPGWKARSNLLLGKIQSQLGDTTRAAAAYNIALEQPSDWHGVDTAEHVRKQLVRFLLQSDKPALARREIANLENPNDPETCWLLCRCDLQEGKTPSASLQALAAVYRKAHPLEPEPSPHVGERACAGCHKTEYGTQHTSRHARTYLRHQQYGALPFPDKPMPDPSNPAVIHSFQNRSDGLEIQTRVADKVFTNIVDYAFGSGDRGLTFVGHDERSRPFECRVSYYAEPIGWDVTSGHPSAPDLPPELYEGMLLTTDAVRRCFVCHVTNAYAVMNRSGPEASDSAIGCERCHGPGGNHTKLIAASRGGISKDVDLAIARPTLAQGADIVALCAGCHSPRDKDVSLPPGSPDSVRFQGSTLTWSRCYTESGNMLSCVTCHNPHKNADKKREVYERRCLDCHGNSTAVALKKDPTPGQPRRITASACPVEPAHNCIECHMPKVKTPMAHAEFTDHFIRVRRPDDLADKSTLSATH
jgi:predicted negative regulator of RcsB-dependent stress response/formate-dependent nitrite reductase cytochrome c552 subunit